MAREFRSSLLEEQVCVGQLGRGRAQEQGQGDSRWFVFEHWLGWVAVWIGEVGIKLERVGMHNIHECLHVRFQRGSYLSRDLPGDGIAKRLLIFEIDMLAR